jgi:hypothetical protein
LAIPEFVGVEFPESRRSLNLQFAPQARGELTERELLERGYSLNRENLDWMIHYDTNNSEKKLSLLRIIK